MRFLDELPRLFAWGLVLGMVLCTTTAQIIFKLAAQYSLAHAGIENGWILNPWLWFALAASILGMGFWMLALKRLPLAVAYPWTASVYVLTPLVSTWAFQDTVSPQYIAGLVFVCLGILITTRSVKAPR